MSRHDTHAQMFFTAPRKLTRPGMGFDVAAVTIETCATSIRFGCNRRAAEQAGFQVKDKGRTSTSARALSLRGYRRWPLSSYTKQMI